MLSSSSSASTFCVIVMNVLCFSIIYIGLFPNSLMCCMITNQTNPPKSPSPRLLQLQCINTLIVDQVFNYEHQFSSFFETKTLEKNFIRNAKVAEASHQVLTETFLLQGELAYWVLFLDGNTLLTVNWHWPLSHTTLFLFFCIAVRIVKVQDTGV